MKQFMILAALLTVGSTSAFAAGSKDDSSPEVATAKVRVEKAKADLAKVEAKQADRKEYKEKLKELAEAAKAVQAARLKLKSAKAKTSKQIICDLADELCPSTPVKVAKAKKPKKKGSKKVRWDFDPRAKAKAKKHKMTCWNGRMWTCCEGHGYDSEEEICKPFATPASSKEETKTAAKPTTTPPKPQTDEVKLTGKRPTMGHLRQLYKVGKENRDRINYLGPKVEEHDATLKKVVPQVEKNTKDIAEIKERSVFVGGQVETGVHYGTGGLGPTLRTGLFLKLQNKAGTFGFSGGGVFATNFSASPLVGGVLRFFNVPFQHLMIEYGVALDFEELHEAKNANGSSKGVWPSRIRLSVALGLWGVLNEWVALGAQFFPGVIFHTRGHDGGFAFTVGGKFSW